MTKPSQPSPRKPWKKRLVFRLLGLYPPYFGAGVWVTRVARDISAIEVRMKLRFWNRNYVGTHFGGSLYSMVDPFYMLMMIELLGPGYLVWDKAATIHFRRPGRGTVHARFEIPPEEVARVRELADNNDKVEPVYTVEVRDADGELVAEVEKVLWVKKKRRNRAVT
ncbi:MAG: DUF4442 domain-containing protein [Acidobacteriota bacterium]